MSQENKGKRKSLDPLLLASSRPVQSPAKFGVKLGEVGDKLAFSIRGVRLLVCQVGEKLGNSEALW